MPFGECVPFTNDTQNSPEIYLIKVNRGGHSIFINIGNTRIGDTSQKPVAIGRISGAVGAGLIFRKNRTRTRNTWD
jgi:hypothetical protein